MVPTTSRSEWRWVWSVSLLILALASLPYLVGWLVTPDGYRFSGFLINPLDGHSYLAKIGQGAAGEWLFRLPYTADRHQPVFMFTFHLALGHLAPGASPQVLVLVYHLTRVILGLGLLLAVYWAAGALGLDPAQRRLALLVIGTTSGLGWLSGQGPDLLVPEAVTFASLLVNAHFGLTACLMLVVIVGATLGSGRWWWLTVALASACLTMIQPFAVLIVAVAAGGWLAVSLVRQQRLSWVPTGRLALAGAVALPWLGYDLWTTRSNPAIGQWMAQNQTPSPPAWQWLVGYGLLWVLAAAGARLAIRRRAPGDILLLVWAVGQSLLLFLPIALQRRLSTGLHLPLGFLAAVGLSELLASLRPRTRRWLTAALLVALFPSNLLLMAAGVSGVVERNPLIVLDEDVWHGMAWLRENVPRETVVLADEETGTLVPAWGGGLRVVYGHPFETLEVDAVRTSVGRFFAGQMTDAEQAALVQRYGVGLILVRTAQYPAAPIPAGFQPVWQRGSLAIYRAEAR